jgi:NarL family two-component system response regulator LiaR
MAEGVPIRVMVVEGYAIVRNGIKFSLLAFEDIEVVGEAGSAEEALLLFPEVRPDVVLMDLMLPDKGGIKTTRAMREACPRVQVLVLSSFPEGRLVQEALLAGAIGFLLKDIAVVELAEAIRQAAQGKPTLAPAAVQALVHATTSPGQDLTEREHDVLALLVEGLSNDQIAERLVISTPTVKFHVRSIRSKLGAMSRTEMVALALQHGLVK